LNKFTSMIMEDVSSSGPNPLIEETTF